MKKISITTLKNYCNYYYSLFYRKFLFDAKAIKALEDKKLRELGFKLDYSIKKLNKILQEKYGRDFKRAFDSIHWLIFSALSIKKRCEKILEIGTYDGEFTYILGKLFRESEITTVDLPANDPLLTSLYNRDNEVLLSEYLQRQKGNIKLQNINAIKANTFFLLDEVDENDKFDLIWVDGGHLYPEIAWDLCNAYFLLDKGGILLCDDVLMSDRYYKGAYVSTESYEVLKYIEQRISNPMIFFLKRLDPNLYSRWQSRRYVAMLTKEGENPGILDR